MDVRVDKTYKTDNITLSFITGLGWDLSIGAQAVHFNKEKFEELKAVMAEVLYGTVNK
jgi:hypothetical protein